MQEQVQTLMEGLEAQADPKRAAFTAGYHPTAMRILGVANPLWRSERRLLSGVVRGWPGADVVALAQALIDTGVFEARSVGIELVAKHRGARSLLDREVLEVLGEGGDNWASVDQLGTQLAGPAWVRGQLSDDAVAAWAGSPDRWWRRTALVCAGALNKRSCGGSGDTPRTRAICEQLVADRDDMVVKGLSWALREWSTTDPAAVRDFLVAYDGVLAARVLREVRNKLRTGRKSGKAP